MSAPNDPRKRFRRRRLTRFSLRTALVVTTVLAVWLGMHMNSVRKQRAAIEAVQRHGGEFAYDYKVTDDLLYAVNGEPAVPVWLLDIFGRDHFHDVVWMATKESDDGVGNQSESDELFLYVDRFPKLKGLTLRSSEANAKWLKYASQRESLRALEVWGSVDLSECGISHPANFNKLERLDIVIAQVTGDFLHELSGKPHLRRLSFMYCELAGNGAKHLQELTQLHEFTTFASGITDEDLIHLAQLTQLRKLSLYERGVTEDGLQHLVSLKNLEQLWLGGCQVKDVSWLQKRLPKCKILL
ncbi:MAG: hypothetical protein WD049_10005 [Candidatus Paceibacterota bacterium]